MEVGGLCSVDLMEAIPLCDNMEVHIYLCLDTTKSSVVSNYINLRMATCFGHSRSHLQASLKVEQVP
jgi:hypothetical protein